MLEQSVRRYKQGGEIATVLAIVSMVFIGVGVLLGSSITQNASRRVNTGSEAQEITSPTPIDKGRTSYWFTGSTGGKCLAWFTCTSDPIVKKLSLKSKATGQTIMDFGVDKNGKTPIDLVVGVKCPGNYGGAKGLQVDFRPDSTYPASFRQKYNVGRDDVVLSVVGVDTNYFIYARPAGLGTEDVDFYFEYDAEIASVVQRYSQVAHALGGCVQTTPTPTVSVTPPSGTPSVTPTKTYTPTPTPPGPVACFEVCEQDSQCQGTTPKGPMRCARFGDGNIRPTSAPLDRGNNPFGKQATTTALAKCNPANGDICRCIPIKCRNIEECDDPIKACDRTVTPTVTPPSGTPSVTPSVTISVTPTTTITPTITVSVTPTRTITPTVTISVTPTPPVTSCSYQAIAYVQECSSWIDKDKGICARDKNNNYIGTPIKDAAFLARPGNESHLLDKNIWKVTNNKGALGLLTYLNSLQSLTNEGYKTNTNRSLTLNKYLTNDLQFVPSITNTRETNKPLIDIQSSNTAQANSRYFENESASVTVNIDGNRYQFLPTNDGGREIRECSNPQLGLTGTASCDMNEFDLTVNDPSKKNTISGFKVRCGQVIEYGWTLQKCIDQPLDMMFVIDTSLTTKDFGDTIDREKQALREFVQKIVTEPNVARIGIVQFNNTSRTILNLTSKNNTQEIFAAIDRLSNSEGTRIDRGLEEGYKALSRNVNRNNKRVIVLMSDGRANPLESNRDFNTSCSNTQHLTDGCREEVIKNAASLKSAYAQLEADLISIKFGTFVDTPFDQFKNPPLGLGEQYLMQKLASTITDGTGQSVPLYYDAPTGQDPYGVLASAYDKFKVKLNSCALAQANFAESVRSADVDGNGFINTADLYLVYDNYFAEGQNIKGDVNKDGRVDALDPTLVINQIGTSVPQQASQ